MHLDDLSDAQAAVTSLLESLAADDWGKPTPCDDWDVADVVRHLIVGERAFVTSLGGTPYDLPRIRAEIAEVAQERLMATYDVGAERLRAALEPELGSDQTFPTGLGPMPATAVAELRTIEALAHGWDLARAVGRAPEADEAVAERAITHSLALMARLPPDRTPFGPPQPVPDDAPAIDRLAGLLGRTVPT